MSNGKPLLSVVIPSRNCVAYLPHAVRSIRAVTGIDPIEIMVVNDGSSDGTADWLVAVQQQDPWLKTITLGGVGAAAARNAGVAAARADIIGFLDADDIWLPGAITERFRLFSEQPNLVLSFADYDHRTPTGESLGTCFGFWPGFRAWLNKRKGLICLGASALPLILAENIIGTSTVLARRTALDAAGGFSADYKVAEDWDLWLRLARVGDVWCNAAVETDYLVRPGSTSRNLPAVIEAMQRIIALHRLAVAALDPVAVRSAEARVLIAEAELARERRQWPTALLKHGAAFWKRPSLRTAWEGLRDCAGAMRLIEGGAR